MGRETKTFRQTKRSGGSDNSNQNYAKINRQGPWNKQNMKIMNKENKYGKG